MAANCKATLDAFDELIYGKSAHEFPEIEQGTSARRRFIATPETKPQPIIIEEGTGYVEQCQRAEFNKVLEITEKRESFQKNIIPDAVYDNVKTKPVVFNERIKQKAKCFEKYDFTKQERSPLAIDIKREEILKLLQNENVIVVEGFTGCGKTTQIPQFILDDCHKSRKPCNIVVTQPRRVAAMTVASRVCQERSWSLGTVVGYVVGMDSQVSSDTSLTYVTTGCLLESLVSKKSLEDYTHIIVDEIHERDADTDLLLMIIRKLLHQTDNSAKVILMSATANAETFAKYMKEFAGKQPIQAPIVSVNPTDAVHPVSEFYLDDLHRILPSGIRIPSESHEALPYISSETYELAAQSIASLDQREITRFGRHREYTNVSSARGAVLVFLPGAPEIEAMHKTLDLYDQQSLEKMNYWYILPLHSRVTSDEQRKVFQKPGSGHQRKIILSTNIAESSITVPDIRYVIDFCLVKHLVTDSETNYCKLKLDWASKSSCTQRKGRVGRVCEGVVFRMVHKRLYENVLPKDTPPEILRSPLEHSVLRVKQLEMGPPQSLLGLLIDPPNIKNIVYTILTLKEIGAMSITADGEVSLVDGDLSYLGRVVARLPIDVHLGKLIMLGYIFNVFDECVVMAAGLASKNIFNYPRNKKLMAYRVKMRWDQGAFSDPICILNVYQAWKQMHLNNEFSQLSSSPRHLEKNWAFENFIDLKALKDMDNMVNELLFQLKRMGIGHAPNIRPLEPSEKALLCLAAIHGAFYPQYFSRNTSDIDEEIAVKSLGGMCPYSTVKLRGFPKEEPYRAYLKQLKDGLRDVLDSGEDYWRATIKVEEERVLIKFHQEATAEKTSRICLPVYLAVKKRHTDSRYILNITDRREADNFSRKVEEDGKRLLGLSNTASVASSNFTSRSTMPPMIHLPNPLTPSCHEYHLDLTISHTESPGRFWCQRLDSKSRSDYNQIRRIIGEGGKNLKRFNAIPDLKKGCMVMGPFQAEENGCIEYFRAKVVGIQKGVPAAERRVRLYFIDFGNPTEICVRDLMRMPDALVHFPPLAFECRLRGIGPSLKIDPRGNWSLAAKEFLISQGVNQRLKAEIYSVIDGVTAMDLLKAGNEDWEESFAKQLVRMRLAVSLEEPYLSNVYHRERLDSSDSNLQCLENYHKNQLSAERVLEAESMVIDSGIQMPRAGGRKHKLFGPSSPLEIKLFSKFKQCQGCNVDIAGDSVNSVLLDSQPGYMHERFLIAAQVTNSSLNNVTARNTTLLPYIPGLPSIFNLIFAPRAEFRIDEKGQALAGAICGLGFDYEKQHSLYESHDMEISFDTEINQKDVLDINKIRFWINSVLGARVYTFHHPEAPTSERMKEVNLRVMRLLFDLLKKPREHRNPRGSNSFEWNKIPKERRLRSAEDLFDSLLPQLDAVRLIPRQRLDN